MRFFSHKQQCYLVGEGSFSGRSSHLPESIEYTDSSLGIAQSIMQSAKKRLSALMPLMSQKIEVKADVEPNNHDIHRTDEASSSSLDDDYHSKAQGKEVSFDSSSLPTIEIVESDMSLRPSPDVVKAQHMTVGDRYSDSLGNRNQELDMCDDEVVSEDGKV